MPREIRLSPLGHASRRVFLLLRVSFHLRLTRHQPITMEGYLMKRGGKTDRKWQRRYCALELLQDANMYVITYRVKKGVRPARNAVFVVA